MADLKALAGVSRRAALIGGAGLAATLAACRGGRDGDAATGGSPGAGGGGGGEHAGYRFTFVNHVTTNPFFTATQYGAADACALVGCSYQWTGSQNSNVSEMTRAVQTAINNKADGIAVAIVDAHAFDAPIAQAIAAGIPVVSYNADAPKNSNDKRLAYIGQDLFVSGQLMGKRIVDALPGGGHVGLFIATPGSLNIQPRIDGAIDAIKKSGKHVTYEQIASGALVAQEHSTVESYYLGHRDVKGMFAVDGGTTEGIGIISKKYDFAKKKIATGGFDLLPGTLAAIESGDLGFAIDQQPYLQGYFPVLELYLFKKSGTLMSPADVDTGLKFVTKDNVAPYLAGASRFEGK